MNVLPAVRTTFGTDAFAAAIRAAEPSITRTAAGIIWAQWALETGRGDSCWNNNIGNVKCTPAQAAAGVPLMMLRGTWEIIAGRRVVFEPPHEQTWFRSFASLADGMRHHVAFLRDRRYRPAWPAVLAGDPTAFAAELKRLGYYTDPLEAYAGGMRHLHAEWMREADWPLDVEPTAENTIASVAHGTHVVDWALEARQAASDAAASALLVADVGGLHRYDEVA